MSNQVEVMDAANLTPAGPDLEGGSPGAGSVAPNACHGPSSVSTWLTTILSREAGSGMDHGANAKVLGLPTFQIENGPPVRGNSVPQLYLDSGNGLPASAARAQMGHSCGLAHPPGALDFAPLQLTVQNAPRGSAGVGPGIPDLALAQSMAMDPGVLAAAGLQPPGAAISDPSVLFTGPLVDRGMPEAVAQPPAARLCGPDGAGQVHLLVQDLQALPNKGFALPVKVENRVGSVPARGVTVPDLRPLSSLVAGVAGEEVPGGLEPSHLLQHHAVQQPQMHRMPKPTRWKPNPAQLCLLERHFNSGYKRPTPELYAAVKGAGEAKEAQVSVWLKNRLARSKDRLSGPASKAAKAPDSGRRNASWAAGPDREGGVNEMPVSGQKRPREEGADEESWDDYHKMSQAAIREVATAMAAIDGDEVTQLVKEVCSARKVCCYGVGRERLVMKALAMRLCHMGVDACMVGEARTPAVGKGDLVMASAGPSYYNTVNAICLAAIRAQAKVIAFTAHQTAPLPFADKAVRIPIPFAHPIPSYGHKAPKVEVPNGNAHKVMQLGSAFEVTLWMMFECMCIMIQKKLGVQEVEMLERHTNLE
ncbi:unnamed protein product [Ostreobium quekettii]|uniref:Homeobox domain-containing protein n=1 Tax=Ostreobium quekettii TaxID=121088 RepID=A0A8S1IMG8_9CHLO|nr:unnamed protein product [Ostreobium quekettii]|eukprot:evm.model.scf_1058.1 EVM.evm.TU.scf_1058.1   scf_1058:2397-4908(+)